MSEPTQEHERIFLTPPEEADPFEGRQWCQDDGNWESPGVEFVRSDIAEKARAASYRAGRIAQAEGDARIVESVKTGTPTVRFIFSASIRANAERLRAENEGDAK